MKETREQMKRLMEKIQMPEEGIAQLLEARKELEEADHWDVIVQTAEQVMAADGELSILTQALAETEAREEALGVNRYLLDALMLWCCWEEVKVRYEKQGLPVEIYYKSLEDMKWKMLECYEIHGVYGNFVGHWYDGFFNLTRFGLGRLQFELRPFEGKKDCGLDGVRIHPGDTVINMHIPSAGPMKPELLEDAFARAEAFFKEYFPKDYRVFGVESWLIDPDLVQILPEGNMKAYACLLYTSYKVPTRLDMGKLRVEFESSYEPTGPFGAKSIGEIVINTPSPALAHAIYNATGLWFRELPITSEKIAMGLLKK